jgi:hypothetical protein
MLRYLPFARSVRSLRHLGLPVEHRVKLQARFTASPATAGGLVSFNPLLGGTRFSPKHGRDYKNRAAAEELPERNE